MQPPHSRSYNVVEYCRRRFREIIYCSDVSLCLNAMTPNIKADDRTDMVDGSLRLDAGDPMAEVRAVAVCFRSTDIVKGEKLIRI